MIPSRAAVLKSVPSRNFTSYSVNGFTGAVGNTPLVRDRSLLSPSVGALYLSPVDADLSERPFGKDGIENLWQSRIPKPWWEREG